MTLTLPTTISFEYVDGDGNGTYRTVDITSATPTSDHVLFQGICHDRNAVRSFRSDRIQCFINEDGEIIKVDQFIGQLEITSPQKNRNTATTPKPTAHRKPKWGIWLLAISLIPAVLIFLAIALLDKNYIAAIIAFAITAVPVFLVRWTFRKMVKRLYKRKSHHTPPIEAAKEAFAEVSHPKILCTPAPELDFEGKLYCLTGTFEFGTQKECEEAIVRLGGKTDRLKFSTDVLVIGSYATKSWTNETFGRKIEEATEMRKNGRPISIVSEAHWRTFID